MKHQAKIKEMLGSRYQKQLEKLRNKIGREEAYISKYESD